MTTDPNPKLPGPPPGVEAPRSALLVLCAQCGRGVDVPMPIDQEVLAIVLAQSGWYAAVMAPSEGQPGALPVLAALCATCAPTSIPPEALKAAEERRQALLRSLQLLAQQGKR